MPQAAVSMHRLALFSFSTSSNFSETFSITLIHIEGLNHLGYNVSTFQINISPPSSELKKVNCLLHAALLFGLFFNPENGGNRFLLKGC
jgi:hypothetical protein